MNLLLINDKILDIELITNNLLNTTFLIFNKETDTYDSLIEKIPSGNFSNVGILQDNPFTGNYVLLDSFGTSIVKDVATLDPNLVTWNNFLQLVNHFKTIGMTALHFLQCNEVSEDWNYLKSKFLESQISIEFSLNKTGLGGDWILESSNLNLVGMYFTEGILSYPHSLGAYISGNSNITKHFSLNFSQFVHVINNNNMIVSWGTNKKLNPAHLFSAFGTNLQSILTYETTIPFDDNGNRYYQMSQSNVICISLHGENSVYIVLSNGNVLENNPEFNTLSGTFGQALSLLTFPDSNKIKSVFGSYENIFFLDSIGDVYTNFIWKQNAGPAALGMGINSYTGYNREMRKITTFTNKIKSVHPTETRTIFLDVTGNLYICGTNNAPSGSGFDISFPNGSLGQGVEDTNSISLNVPSTLKDQNGISITTKFKRVSSVFFHTFAIDIDGYLWGWGTMHKNPMDTYTPTDKYLISYYPMRIKDINGNNITTKFKEVSTSKSHTVAIDEFNNLWSWGENTYGQLGNNLTSTTFNPIPVKVQQITENNFKAHNIISTEVGTTIIGYLTSSGELRMLSCGRNGLSKIRDPYDSIDIRPDFRELIDSRAPILYNPYPFISNLSSTSGSVGNSITINGKGFFGLVPEENKSLAKTSTAVTFGNVPAVINSITDTQITVTVPTGTGTNLPVIVTNTDGDSNNNSYGSATFSYSSSSPPTTTSTNICFVAGTPIKTDQGSIDIERINIDKHTINKNKIIAITKTKNETDDSLVFFEKNSIAKNYPKKDTIISRRHKILYKGVFKEAQEYINETTIYEIKYNDETLYNVLLDKHSTMKVNNLICETLHPENKVALFYKEKIKEGLSADKILIQFKSPIF
jgi:alpha-tubulin suppressor-like RCC1 family protein